MSLELKLFTSTSWTWDMSTFNYVSRSTKINQTLQDLAASCRRELRCEGQGLSFCSHLRRSTRSRHRTTRVVKHEAHRICSVFYIVLLRIWSLASRSDAESARAAAFYPFSRSFSWIDPLCAERCLMSWLVSTQFWQVTTQVVRRSVTFCSTALPNSGRYTPQRVNKIYEISPWISWLSWNFLNKMHNLDLLKSCLLDNLDFCTDTKIIEQTQYINLLPRLNDLEERLQKDIFSDNRITTPDSSPT